MKDPMIGQQLANFRVERLLGQGGMATVYYGMDIKLQRPVAIKVIDKRYKNDPAHASRFVNEARMMAKWRHENLIQIYYADDEQEYSYYVMEYVEGNDLSTVMSIYAEDKELMPTADVLRIGNAIASALDYAHRQGVIHRDIKPSNILIANDSRVLVGDFGLALEVRDGSMGNIFGTPHYISPEQARRSADATPQSDLYSLGVILYEILTGSVPFNDPSPASIALQHISQPPPPPRSINPQIAPAVENVILKALEKNPHNRYQTGAKLMSALEEAFKSAGSTPKLALPPLPVGVPTIRRSGVPIDQLTKLRPPKGKGNTIHERNIGLPATVRASNQPQKKRSMAYFILVILLLLGIGSLFILMNRPASTTILPASTFTSAPLTSTPVPAQPTHTLIPASSTPLPTSTSVLSTEPPILPTHTLDLPTHTATATETQISSTNTSEPAPTSTSTPVLAVGVPTIKYPNGNHLSLFWNDTSFHMLNRAREQRSLAGFKFERLDQNNLPTDAFSGFLWENVKFSYLPSKYCVSIKIYGDDDPPYLDPSDCRRGFVSIVQPRVDEDREMFFWNPKAGSTEFRVLWVNEEIARCQISAQVCEIYIP